MENAMNSTQRYFAQDYAAQLRDGARDQRLSIDQLRNAPGWGRPEDLARADRLEASLDRIDAAFAR
jgi:hypothetical protein